MTVGELRAALGNYPSNQTVLVNAFDQGFEPIERIRVADVVNEPKAPLWRGDHRIEDDGDPPMIREDTVRVDRITAVILDGRAAK